MSLAEAFEEKLQAERLGDLLKELRKREIDPSVIEEIDKVKLYQGFMKDADGNAQVVDLSSIQLNLKGRKKDPDWPVIQPGPTYKLPTRGTKAYNADGLKRAVIYPDMQTGYFYDDEENLVPTHDEAAFAVLLRIIKDVRPSRVIGNGDNIDFPEFSTKFRLTPAFARTSQAAIDRKTLFNAELRAAAPEAELDEIEGNHELRVANLLLDNAKAAFGLRQGGKPESWPVMSYQNLTRMDDFGMTYHPGYPASKVWINDRVKVIHGTFTGPTAAQKYLSTEKVSVIVGHDHRRFWAEKTTEDVDGPRVQFAMSAGCLADLGGNVPATRQGMSTSGRPIRSTEAWQQGCIVLTYREGDGEFWPEMVPFHAGRAMYRGKIYEASL